MGKGGRSSNKSSEVEINAKISQLSRLDTEALRKWAAAYGVAETEKMDKERVVLELIPYADGIMDPLRPANLPLEPPKFTLKTIRDAIPPELFKRDLITSFSHLIVDLVLITISFVLSTHITSFAESFEFRDPQLVILVKSLLWCTYWYLQGTFMTGVWVIAHECGHQAFSDYEWVNNVVGTIFHSLLLVPYHPWRISHGKHHNNTGSCENDEVFCPSTRNDWKDDALRTTPIQNWWGIFLMLTFGWWPGYLLFNATGPAKYRNKPNSHISPNAVFIDPKDYWLAVQSDIALFAAFGLLLFSIYTFGFSNVAFFYLIPEMIVNMHLVLITFLQHTDVFMPHFRGAEWNWLRGALCTVDRQYGKFGFFDARVHHITDSHVCHHLFSGMPFYHAKEATKYIAKVLGPYYMKDDTPVPHALYRAFSTCLFVEDVGTTVFYKNVK